MRRLNVIIMDHQLISESPNSTDDFMPSSVDSSDYAQISDESVLPEISYPQCSFQNVGLQHKYSFLQSCIENSEAMSKDFNPCSNSYSISGNNSNGRLESHSSCNLSSNVIQESATSENSYLSHLGEHNPEVYLLPSCRHKTSNHDNNFISIIDCDDEHDECDDNNKESDFSIDEASGDSELWVPSPSDDIENSDECSKSLMKRKSNLTGERLDSYWSKKFCRIPSSACYSDHEGCDEDRDDSNSVSMQNYNEVDYLSGDMKTWLDTFQNWSHSNRLVALDHLIKTCEIPQVRYMMEIIEPQFQRDFISLLPKELALYVLSFLEPKDLLKAAQTCRYWRILAEDNLLWREKCREVGLENFHEFLGRRRHYGSSMGAFPSPWKTAYMRQHNIEMNWRFRPIKPSKILKGHDDHVITCLQFSGNRIVSGSDDNTLKVWSATTGKCLRALVGHTGGVWSSQMSGNIIISGSTDRTLKVWNAETGACIHTLHGHSSTVRCMHLHGKKVVSGSRDATLRVWDVDSGHCLHVLIGHVAAVRCVQYDGRLVVSGAYDYMVKVWNPEREECLHTLQGHTNRVYSLQFDGIHVVSGSLDTSIKVWDVETGQCKHTLVGHQSLTSGMELKNNILVSGNADSTVKVWDISTGQCLQTLSGSNKHQSAVTCLQFNNKFVITSSDDGTVKLWDVRTGEFVRNLVILESGGSGGVVWRLKANHTKLVCAVGSRNGTEETKLMVLDFDVPKK